MAFSSKCRIWLEERVFAWVVDFSRNVDNALATVRLWCEDANVELSEILTVRFGL